MFAPSRRSSKQRGQTNIGPSKHIERLGAYFTQKKYSEGDILIVGAVYDIHTESRISRRNY
jgi:hypothetical protein